MTTEILTEIIKSGGVVGLLIAIVIYFLKREKKLEKIIEEKDAKIEKLQEASKEDQKEYLTLVYKVLAYFEKGDENFKDFKAFISEKIDSLKNIINVTK